MRDTTKLRFLYWAVIVGLIIWIAHQQEEIETLKYADAYLRSSIRALRARVLGIPQ